MSKAILRFYCLFVLSLLPVVASAGVLKGKVTDAKGEPLPFSIVYIEGTTNGTTTNADALYQLALPEGKYKVVCQYMGYRQQVFNLNIGRDETVTHNFALQEQNMEMKAVVVKANREDPAYAIIRKAIKKRKMHLEQVRSFQSSIYLKGVLRSRSLSGNMLGVSLNGSEATASKKEMGMDSAGRGVLYLCEEEADYYAKDGKDRTVIRSVRESGNPNGFGLSKMPPIITFYENNVAMMSDISPRGFVSPISDNALHYYKYKYEGEFREGGYTIDKITVIPRRDYEPLLQGTIYIVEDDWAIHSLDLLATTKSNLEFLDTLRFQQTHLKLKKDTWVVKNQVLYPTIKILMFDISGYFATVYDKQKVNEPVPDSLFSSKTESVYDKTANKKDTTYWTANRPIPLEQDETKDYNFKDSMRSVQNDPVRADSLRRKGNKFRPMSLLMGGVGYSGKANKFRINTNALLDFNLLNFNSVEGLNIAPKLGWRYRVDTGKILTGDVIARYGFSNTHFNLLGRIAYTNNSRTWIGHSWKLGAEGGKYVYQYNSVSTLSQFLNTYTTLVEGRNYMKLYERWGGALFFERKFGNGLSIFARADYQHRLPVNNTTAYSWAKKGAAKYMTSNYPAELSWVTWQEHNAALLDITVSYSPGYTYTQYPDYKVANRSEWPLFSVRYTKGLPGIFNSKSDFDKWKFTVEDDVSLKLMGSMSYKLSAGGFFNKKYISIPDAMHLADNQLVLAAPYLQSFQLAAYYRYSNAANLYGELHLEYSLKGLLTNKIPLLRQAKWYMVAGTNTFYAGQKNYYTEVFAGIDNLGYKWYRFLRLDVVQGWDGAGRSFTGLRIGINPNSIAAGLKFGSGAGSGDL